MIGARQRAGEMGGPGRAARKGPGRGRGARLWPAQMAGARCTGWIGPSRAYTRACRRARGSEGGPTPVAFAEAGREPTPTRTVGRRAGADQCREAIASPGAGPRIAVRAHRATAGACGVTRGHDRGARAGSRTRTFSSGEAGGSWGVLSSTDPPSPDMAGTGAILVVAPRATWDKYALDVAVGAHPPGFATALS